MGWSVEPVDGAGRDVGGGADLERHLVLDEVLDQRRVLDRRRAVADAFGAEVAQRVPDRLRAGRLAGVRHAVQPGRAGPVEHGLELRPVDTDLRAAQAEPDQRVGRMVEREAEGVLRRRQAELAGDVVDPAQPDAVVALGRDAGVLDGLDEGLDRGRPACTEVHGVSVSSA